MRRYVASQRLIWGFPVCLHEFRLEIIINDNKQTLMSPLK